MPKKPTAAARQRQNAEVRKPEIIKSFYRTILEEGFEGASIAKVARRIGIHPSLILHYFETKENLTLGLVDYVIREYARMLEKVELTGLSGEERLKKLLEILWSREYYEKIHIASSFGIIAVSFRNPRIQKKIQRLYAEFGCFLESEIERAVAAGVIPAQDAGRSAEKLMTLIEGSRHFRHFFVREDAVGRYNLEMRAAARAVLNAGETVPHET